MGAQVAHDQPRLVFGGGDDDLVAPGFTQHKLVADALIAQATKLRAVALLDGKNTTTADALAYRAQFDDS
ncbi:MAG: hypothetical protein ACK4TK_10035, partial [Thiobacillaceae bacterium]